VAKIRAVTEAFKTLVQVATHLGLTPHPDPDFLKEWQRDLPGVGGRAIAIVDRASCSPPLRIIVLLYY